MCRLTVDLFLYMGHPNVDLLLCMVCLNVNLLLFMDGLNVEVLLYALPKCRFIGIYGCLNVDL